MHRRGRIDVVKAQEVFVFVDFLGGISPAAILQKIQLALIFPVSVFNPGAAGLFRQAGQPSRRASSASTSSGRSLKWVSATRQWNHRSAVSLTMRSGTPSWRP